MFLFCSHCRRLPLFISDVSILFAALSTNTYVLKKACRYKYTIIQCIPYENSQDGYIALSDNHVTSSLYSMPFLIGIGGAIAPFMKYLCDISVLTYM